MNRLFSNQKPTTSLLKRLFTLLTAFCFVLSLSPIANGAKDGDDVLGSDVSQFSTTDIFGSSVNGSIFNGKKVVVLHYFATWSSECVSEMEFIQSAYENYSQSEIGVYGLLHEDSISTPASCASLMQSLGYNYRCLKLDSVLSSLVSIYPLIPQTFFINSSGVVIEHFPGVFTDYEQLTEIIDQQVGHPATCHSVRFIDGLSGDVIKREVVAHLASATPPTPPVHAGYEFTGWSGSYTNVTENRVITANYTSVTPTYQQGDVDMDGSITIYDALLVLRAALNLSFADAVATLGDMDGDGSITVFDALTVIRLAINQ